MVFPGFCGPIKLGWFQTELATQLRSGHAFNDLDDPTRSRRVGSPVFGKSQSGWNGGWTKNIRIHLGEENLSHVTKKTNHPNCVSNYQIIYDIAKRSSKKNMLCWFEFHNLKYLSQDLVFLGNEWNLKPLPIDMVWFTLDSLVPNKMAQPFKHQHLNPQRTVHQEILTSTSWSEMPSKVDHLILNGNHLEHWILNFWYLQYHYMWVFPELVKHPPFHTPSADHFW